MSTGTVIARGGLNLRKSPKTGDVIQTLRRGAEVKVLGEETWLRVKSEDGHVGFVLSDFVEFEPGTVTPPSEVGSGATDDGRGGSGDLPQQSDICDIQLYRNTQFVGKDILADKDFWPSLDRINRYAEECNVKVHVTSSAREPGRTVTGAIVKPAGRSNHLVGHAIDMNVILDGVFFNSKKLKKSKLSQLPDEVRGFLKKIRDDAGLRWGGDFSAEDPVHIDDGLNVKDSERWDKKLASR